MPSPVPPDIRQRIWHLCQAGLASQAIALAVGCCPRTVRNLVALFARGGGAAPACYQACGRPRSPAFSALREMALCLRRLNPGWGSGRILVVLGGLPGVDRDALPGESTVRHWLAQAGLAPAPTRLSGRWRSPLRRVAPLRSTLARAATFRSPASAAPASLTYSHANARVLAAGAAIPRGRPLPGPPPLAVMRSRRPPRSKGERRGVSPPVSVLERGPKNARRRRTMIRLCNRHLPLYLPRGARGCLVP